MGPGEFDTLNAYLDAQCRKRLDLLVKGHLLTVGERLEQEREASEVDPLFRQR